MTSLRAQARGAAFGSAANHPGRSMHTDLGTTKSQKVYTLQLTEFQTNDAPPYAIASHRWQKDETTFKDVLKGRNQHTPGFAKVRGFCDWVRFWLAPTAGIRWLWIDTACVDQKSSAELSEAINSMYSWYTQARICIAYLHDVELHHDVATFEASEWFTRGWTLQELIAPSVTIFLDKNWNAIGYKQAANHDLTYLHAALPKVRLNDRIARRTGIPGIVLQDQSQLFKLSPEARLSWMDSRSTTKPEDQAYCLLGIFNIHMPLLYGEGKQATTRLLEEILRGQLRNLRGFEQYGGTRNTGTVTPEVSRIINSLQDRISRLEAERDGVQHQEGRVTRVSRPKDRLGGGYDADPSFSTLLEQFNDLQQQTMTEDLKMRKAEAFWNPLTSMLKKDATC